MRRKPPGASLAQRIELVTAPALALLTVARNSSRSALPILGSQVAYTGAGIHEGLVLLEVRSVTVTPAFAYHEILVHRRSGPLVDGTRAASAITSGRRERVRVSCDEENVRAVTAVRNILLDKSWSVARSAARAAVPFSTVRRYSGEPCKMSISSRTSRGIRALKWTWPLDSRTKVPSPCRVSRIPRETRCWMPSRMETRLTPMVRESSCSEEVCSLEAKCGE